VRVVASVSFLALCLGLVDCSSLGKKTSLPKSGAGDRSSAPIPTLGVGVFVSQLRRKIEHDPARPRYLLTEPGAGYRLVAPH